ncbi:hypothetical protein PPERSA_04030 [Pseudocohnilembus persalinus]|uniref:Uncharacterized protein n=1 Tax=Pseudocohnilembus persalinus TaxID=266149 RepID=A0A0V0QKQ7_PSEPJ|nr:hypothetical protein PPERSA_04030 [Pseudocohnilembus persalinus]|eukprot:KRX02827.1 hypothetical protein PPERSA_04030 [Pseudocohnilembus persalinus]
MSIKKLKYDYPFEIDNDFQPEIYCQKKETQIWFNRALFWFYSFHHEECIRCCEQGLLIEEKCPMLYFLKSLAIGINYNNAPPIITENQAKLQFQNWQKADLYKNEQFKLECELINALKYRVGDGKTLEHQENDLQFSQEMLKIYQKYGDKLDINTFNFISELTAESLMLLRPWNLWAQQDIKEQNIKQGDPYENTLLISEIIDKGLKKYDKHPGLRHLWIHLNELSPYPEKALCSKFSKKLRDIAPESGHLSHMPSHIEIQCGLYQQAIQSNMIGFQIDNKYFEYLEKENLPKITFFLIYRCHNIHFLIYAALFAGQKALAIKYSDILPKIITIQYLKDTKVYQPMGADWLEAFIPQKIHVLIRFGEWEQLISDEPFGLKVLPMQYILENQDLYAGTLALVYYGKGIAYSVLAGKDENNKKNYLKKAHEYLDKLQIQKKKVPATRRMLNNTIEEILQIAEKMLIGELNYREQNYKIAFENLKKAVELHDNLPYNEPWGWMIPARHAIAALLLEQGIQVKNDDFVKDAMRYYKEDLGKGMKRCVQHRANVWSLAGLNVCYKYFNMEKEMNDLKPELDKQLKGADIQINTSCFCCVKKLTL